MSKKNKEPVIKVVWWKLVMLIIGLVVGMVVAINIMLR